MNDTMPIFGSVGTILAWAGDNQARYVGNDDKLPYVQKDKLYYYFGYAGGRYQLVMTSDRDIEEKR